MSDIVYSRNVATITTFLHCKKSNLQLIIWFIEQKKIREVDKI